MRRLPLFLLAAVALVASGCDSDDPGASASVTVMTQNLYLGADLFLVAQEPNPQLIPVRAAELYGTMEASEPAARMAAIAAEIADVNPALVGLQEVTTYSVQIPGDNLPGAPNTPATDVTYDFLDLLMTALAAEGADYRVVSVSNNADVELPATTDGVTFFDVRYQDADVILARADVTTSNATEQSFNTLLTIPVGGVDQTFVRGYQTVDATIGDLDFTFLNTHLEVGGAAAPIQVLQAGELVQAAAAISGRLVVVGDINSDGNTGGTSYQSLTVPLTDAVPTGAAPTCCQDDLLRNNASELQTRIDVVMHRGFDEVLAAEVVLDEPADRTGGIWPSDHAGVWAELSATGL